MNVELPIKIHENTRRRIVGVKNETSRRFVMLDDTQRYVEFLKVRVGNGSGTNNQVQGEKFLYAKNQCKEAHAQLRNNMRDKFPVMIFGMVGSDDFIQGVYHVIQETDIHFNMMRVEGHDYSTYVRIDKENSRHIEYQGQVFRSVHEARFARFLDKLGICHNYETVAIKYKDSEKERSYTPDFSMNIMVGNQPQFAFVELKPTFPTSQEICLCETISSWGYPMVLVYGDICPPRHEKSEDIYDRPHKNGLKAMVFREGSAQSCEYVFSIVNDVCSLQFDLSSRNTSWAHPSLLEAYKHANAI